MAKKLPIAALFVAVAGGVYFFLNYRIQTEYSGDKLVAWKIVPKTAASAAASPSRTPRACSAAIWTAS